MTVDAVLLMAYGSPDRLDQVEAYYTDIRRGSPPPPHLLEELLGRYRAIGGGSPLSRIVELQRAAVEAELARRGRPVAVYAGMRHIEPRIGTRRRDDGCRRRRAFRGDRARSAAIVERRRAIGGRSTAPLAGAGRRGSRRDVRRLVVRPAALHRCARRDHRRGAPPLPRPVAGPGHVHRAQPARPASSPTATRTRTSWPGPPRSWPRGWASATWDFAFQSAGRTGEPWLGPDILEEIRRLAADGVAELVVRPVGFVADHLEVLYDIDIEAQGVAREAGIRLERARSMNDDPTFIAGLADLAEAALPDAVASAG